MVVSERTLKWVMRFYPPLLLQRVWVKHVSKDFRTVEVRVFRSFLNTNYNKSIFGGTISSASDPFYAVCLYQILKRKGLNVLIWVKSVQINFLKPAYTSLKFTVSISPADLKIIDEELAGTGKTSIMFSLDIFNAEGELCAVVHNEVYIRKI